ncbi:MAG: methyltransferase domain-containing protein [Polyangiaceae bacterium]
MRTLSSWLFGAALSLALGACGAEPPTTTTPGASASVATTASAAPSVAPSASASAVAAPDRPKAEPYPVPPSLQAIVDAADRSPEDKALDAGRHPGETLAFFSIGPGMKVADLGAGGGYTTELLARAVGAKGKVWGQNSKFLLERFAEKPWSERLAKPIMKNVVRADRDFDDPLPPEAKDLDAVVMVLFYHDTVWQKVDRAKMNANIFKALKPGGIYAIIDHSGREGTGMTETETLHRIEEKPVVDEILAAGFKLKGEAQFLRNPADTRDWNDSPKAAGDKRGTSDRFVLAFVKP